MSNAEDYTVVELLQALLAHADLRETDSYSSYSYEGLFDVDGTDVSIRIQEDAVDILGAIV